MIKAFNTQIKLIFPILHNLITHTCKKSPANTVGVFDWYKLIAGTSAHAVSYFLEMFAVSV